MEKERTENMAEQCFDCGEEIAEGEALPFLPPCGLYLCKVCDEYDHTIDPPEGDAE